MEEETFEEFLEEVEETEELEDLMKKEEKSVRRIMLLAVGVFLLTIFVIVAVLPSLMDSSL